MSVFIGTDGGDPFGDDMRLDSDLDLIAELADQAAQGALISYALEDWQRSPLVRMLDAAVARMRSAGRNLPPAIIEAQERFAAARTALG